MLYRWSNLFHIVCIRLVIDVAVVTAAGALLSAVGAVNVVLRGAALATTNAVVANCVVLVPAVAVGAVGVPVNAGLASGALMVFKLRPWLADNALVVLVDVSTSSTGVAVPPVPAFAITNAVVAICVVFVPVVAVGAVGVPVNAGDARGALVLYKCNNLFHVV